MTKPARQIHMENAEVRSMDEALEADPPVIVWRLDPVRRIQVPVYIYDPHAERTNRKAS